MKTILHISKYYYPDLGGIESVSRFLCENLTDYNHEVICFATDKAMGINYVSGITVHRVPVQLSFMSQDIAFGYYGQLKRIIRQSNPDIVVIHTPNPFLYPMVTRLLPSHTKLVVLWHSDILAKGIMYKAIRQFETALLRRADMIIATSQAYVDHSQPLAPYKDKIQILQNAVNTSMFDKRPGDDKKIAKIRKMYGGKKIVFFVGRHIRYKGIDRLIESEQYVKGDCVFIIAGIGPLTTMLEHKAMGRDRIHFVGRLSDEDLRCHLHAADIFGFSSIYKAEAFGVALAEAMYCRAVPVTFTIDGSGVNWVCINGETGIQVPLDDIHAYAAAIDELLANDAMRNTYADNAQKRIETNFTDKVVSIAANKLFTNLISD